jgi:hypothetical protein
MAARLDPIQARRWKLSWPGSGVCVRGDRFSVGVERATTLFAERSLSNVPRYLLDTAMHRFGCVGGADRRFGRFHAPQRRRRVFALAVKARLPRCHGRVGLVGTLECRCRGA